MASTTETGETLQAAQATANNLRNRDDFFKETYRFFDALGRHRALVVVAATVLVVACVAGGIAANRHEAKSEAGRDALFLAVKASETELKSLAGVKLPGVEAPAKEGVEETPEEAKAKAAADKAKRAEDEAAGKKMEELAFSKLNVDEKFQGSVLKFRDVIAKFDGTRAAHEARMALGTLYFNHGEPAKAAPLFQDAGTSASGSFEKTLALQSWGYALENSGKYAEAVPAYEKALNYGEGSIKGDIWLAIARCQEAMHDAAKARSTYDQIISLLPTSDAAKTAESLKAKLQ
jgi:TolA-binding protein